MCIAKSFDQIVETVASTQSVLVVLNKTIKCCLGWVSNGWLSIEVS